jgi:predicted dehydrogenase
VAFIGLGIMGQRMLAAMADHGGFNLANAWDPDAAACARTRERYPGMAIGESPGQIIQAAETDIVYIASPPQFHREHALAAASAGKAILCEKPLGVDIADSRTLLEAVSAVGVCSAVNFPFAAAPAIALMKNKVDHGELGTVTGVDIRLHFSRWPRGWQQAAVWLSQREAGGFIREVGSHFIFLTERLFGPATLVDTSVRYPDDRSLCETHVVARLDCGGIPVLLTADAGGAGPDIVDFTVHGSDQSLRLSDWADLFSTDSSEWQAELSGDESVRRYGRHHSLNMLLNMLAGEPHTLASLQDALSVQEHIELILKS